MTRGGRGGEQPLVGEATFRSYYGRPIINQPVWASPDIPGYLFLGGLAGASSVVAAAAATTRRRSLARALKLSSTAAIGLSAAALVHDLGRPERFYNMLRVFKPTSPMSVGSWLLAGFAPMSAVASLAALTGRFRFAGAAATAGAAALGPLVATYTAALVCDTAVPAWHEGHRQMPFVFAASALASAAGAGLVAAPHSEAAPLRVLGAGAGAAELALIETMKRAMPDMKGAFEAGKAKRYERGARAATAAGVVAAATLGRTRAGAALAGASLLAGSALARFAIFEAGLASAADPRYTVVPQRRRLSQRGGGPT